MINQRKVSDKKETKKKFDRDKQIHEDWLQSHREGNMGVENKREDLDDVDLFSCENDTLD